jgi:O-antigen/teichoic acid export membrane protein
MTEMQLQRSVVWNVAEVLASSVVLYLIYRLMVVQLGVEALGVWALVLSATSLARLGDLGAASGLSRFTAMAMSAEQGDRSAMPWIQTAFAINLYLYSCLAAIAYLPAYWILATVTSGSDTHAARELLPYAIAAFVLLNISNVGLAALMGLGRGDVKSKLTMVGLVVQALVSALLVQSQGLIGIAAAQIAQQLVVAAGSWLMIRRLDAAERPPLWPFRLHRSTLRMLISFGIRLQGLNIVNFMFEPATKFVFSAVGGLAGLGLYELASRTILQVRQLVVMPAQNLTPLYLYTAQRFPGDLTRVYSETNALTMLVAGISMGAVFLGAPVLSYIWLGKLDMNFVIITAILAVAWFVNMAASPAFLLGIALGRLKWNMVGSAIFTVGSPILAYLLYSWGREIGTVAGIALCVAGGGFVTFWMIPRESGLPAFPGRHSWYVAALKVSGTVTGFLRRLSAIWR